MSSAADPPVVESDAVGGCSLHAVASNNMPTDIAPKMYRAMMDQMRSRLTALRVVHKGHKFCVLNLCRLCTVASRQCRNRFLPTRLRHKCEMK